MMTIHNMCCDLKHRGFTVSTHYNWDETHRMIINITFVIEKAGVRVAKVYDAQHDIMAEKQHQYQIAFLGDLISSWHKKYDYYYRDMMVEGFMNGVKNPDPEIARHAKQIANSVYGKMEYQKIYPKSIKAEEMCKMYGVLWTHAPTPTIKDVIFNDPATIVFWSDGTKTVVKCQEDDIYDPEKGLAMAISKKVLGGNYDYYNTFKKYLKKYEKQVFNPFDVVVQISATLGADDISKTSPADG